MNLTSGTPGITPFLPKTVKPRSGLGITGFVVDQGRKEILYAFGFTRNNAGKDNKRILAMRFIVMEGSCPAVQNNCIHKQCVRYVKISR